MLDDQSPALEAGDEVVQPEAEQVEAAEAPESTEGLEDTPPAESKAEEKTDAKEEEELSESQKRRERRKAYQRELREKAEKAERELAETEASKKRILEAAQSSTRPKESDFQDYNEYLLAAGAWSAEQAMGKREVAGIEREAETKSKELEDLRQQQQAEAQENWAAQRAEAATRYQDFETVISAPTPEEFTPQIAEIIMNSDQGADVAYYLATNRAELRKLAQASPIEQAMAIGRLEATVQAPQPRTTSNAPEPVSTVRPKGAAAADPAKMNADEYRAWRAAGGTF